MKTINLVTVFLFTSLTIRAQVDISTLQPEAAYNYTLYGGEFRKLSPGIKVGATVIVGEDNNRVGLYYTHAFPIKDPSSMPLNPGGSVKTEYTYNFKTLSLDYTKVFGKGERALSTYGKFGAGVAFIKYKEKLNGVIPSGYTTVTNEFDKGFIVSPLFFGLVGTQLSIGKPKVFCEMLLGGPATQANNQDVENIMPVHFGINVGVRFSISNVNE